MTSSNPIGSLPPMPPDLMSSILGDSSALQALSGSPATQQPAAFVDLSASQQVQMAELEDDATLFGGGASSSPFASLEPTPAPAPVDPAYDPSQDVANPAYQDPGAPPPDWTQDVANPDYWA